MAVVIFGAERVQRLRASTTKRKGRGQAISRTEWFLALTYLLVTPATNVALRGLPCEVRSTAHFVGGLLERFYGLFSIRFFFCGCAVTIDLTPI